MATPQAQDFIKGFDPTLASSISPAQLAQMVDAATPATDKGLWITTVDAADGTPVVPDAATTLKWQTYGWRRISATTVSGYLWSPNTASNATYLKWVNIVTLAFAPNTIPAAALQNSSLTDTQINSISASKITGLPTGLPPTGAAGGDLTGNYPNPTVKALAIDGGSAAGRIAADTIKSYNISPKTLEPIEDFKPSATAYAILRTKSDVSGYEEVFNSFIKDLTGATAVLGVAGVNACQIPRVNAAGTALEMVSPGIIQSLAKNVGKTLTNVAVPIDGTIPQITEGVEIASLIITPKRADSILRIRYVGVVTAATLVVTSSVFKTGTANALLSKAITAASRSSVVLEHYIASGAATAQTFSVRAGSNTGGNATANDDSESGAAGAVAWFTIEEISSTLS